jgi:hypothetical protein
MKEYWAAVRVSNIKTGGIIIKVFSVKGETYADAFAQGIEEAYSSFPTDEYTEHELNLAEKDG